MWYVINVSLFNFPLVTVDSLLSQLLMVYVIVSTATSAKSCQFANFMQVKSRMMGDSTYKNTLDCFVKTLRNDVSFFSLCYVSNMSHFVFDY